MYLAISYYLYLLFQNYGVFWSCMKPKILRLYNQGQKGGILSFLPFKVVVEQQDMRILQNLWISLIYQ